ERSEMQVVATATTRGQRVRDQALVRRERPDGDVEEAGLRRPPDQVAPGEAAREPRCPPAGEHDLAAGRVELSGGLATGLPAADDQDRAVRELRRLAGLADVAP